MRTSATRQWFLSRATAFNGSWAPPCRSVGRLSAARRMGPRVHACIGGRALALHKYKLAAAAQYRRCLEDARSPPLLCKHVCIWGSNACAYACTERGVGGARGQAGLDASAQCDVDIEHTRPGSARCGTAKCAPENRAARRGTGNEERLSLIRYSSL